MTNELHGDHQEMWRHVAEYAVSIGKALAAPSDDVWTPAPGVRGYMLYRGADGTFVSRVEIDPGAEVPREAHAEHTETLFVLRGFIEIEEWNTTWGTDIDNGSITIDAGTPHTVRNVHSTEPAELIAILRTVTSTSDTDPSELATEE